mgnify:CR=1 FL=1
MLSKQGGIEMKFLEYACTFFQILTAIIVMILVLLQEGKEDGNIVTGESNRGGTMGSSREARLSKLTIGFGIAFAVLTIASTSLMIFNY